MRDRKTVSKYFLFILLFGIIGTYFYFWSFLDSEYVPYYGDEFYFFKNSESFFIHNTLKASFTYTGHGARLLGADAHGPAYPLLYGLISKFFGWHNLNILIINFGLFLSTLVILIFSGKSGNIQIQQVLLTIGSPITLFYSVTFMPELIHLGIGILLFVFCKNYLATSSKSDFLILLCFIILAGCIRTTWFFALFGLIILPGPQTNFQKLFFALSGALLPILFQHFLHEQVPNPFSEISRLVIENKFGEAAAILIFNAKRNIYFALTYTEGWFYTLQKIWMAGSLLLAIFLFRKNGLIQFGLLIICILISFNIILYKNYTWVDLRVYGPMILFLNLGFFSYPNYKAASHILLALNLISFILILPLQNTLIQFRLQPDFIPIPSDLQTEIKNISNPVLIQLDTLMLDNYSLDQLPVVNNQGELIRYTLPYYQMERVNPDYFIVKENDQLRVYP
ncbi:MAG: hypothetical protein PSV36_10330 [Algoriphagus sp.]|nr:hypothetical protein [Algoriphagus sp.]